MSLYSVRIMVIGTSQIVAQWVTTIYIYIYIYILSKLFEHRQILFDKLGSNR
jgi:hypothetical protein